MSKKEVDLGQLVNSALTEATDVLAENHPRFGKKFIANYLDQRQVQEYSQEIAEKVQSGKLSPKKAYESIASHMVSGDFLTEKGKQIILNKGLEERLGKGKAKQILAGEKYLDKTLVAFKELYELMVSGDYAQRMPELAKAIGTVYDAGFMDAATNILYRRKQLPEGAYVQMKRLIANKVEATSGSVRNYFRHYAASLASSVLAISGILIFLLSNKITGNVIGISKTNYLNLSIGALLFIIGIIIFTLGKRKYHAKSARKSKKKRFKK